jgi:hypothetical protein
VMTKSIRSSEVHSRRHDFHSKFKFQSLDDAEKFHEKYGMLLSIYRLILSIKLVFFPTVSGVPSAVTRFSIVQGSSRSFMVSHTLKTNFPLVLCHANFKD